MSRRRRSLRAGAARASPAQGAGRSRGWRLARVISHGRCFLFDVVPYCTLQRTVRYSNSDALQSKNIGARRAMKSRLGNLMPIQDAKRAPRGQARGTTRGPGRAETAGQRRERIVRAAWPLFVKKGYDNVSIDEIIGVVGGSKATIYAWFGGKEGLFEEV